VTPISALWGTDRGLPIDRYYIERFLNHHAADIHGTVLEIKDSHYATRFGIDRVSKVDVLDIDIANTRATVTADLARADALASGQYDCFILTQTLHIIYDIRSALRHAARLLKPGGVLLCTIPALSRVNYEDGGLERGDYWRLTQAAVLELFSEVFSDEAVRVDTFGNVRMCAAFLYGLAVEDVEQADLNFIDPWFPLIHCVRAVRPAAA
jgi:SAM-dependent methyltransferase